MNTTQHTETKQVQTLKGHTDWINDVSFSESGKELVSGSDDKTVKVWDVASGELKTTITGHSKKVSRVFFTVDARHVVSGSGDQHMRVWDVATGQTTCYNCTINCTTVYSIL